MQAIKTRADKLFALGKTLNHEDLIEKILEALDDDYQPIIVVVIVRIPRYLLMNFKRNLSTRSFPFAKRQHHLYQSLQVQLIPDFLSETTIEITPHYLPGTLHLDLLQALLQITGMVIPTNGHSSVAANGVILKGTLCLNALSSANTFRFGNQWKPRL